MEKEHAIHRYNSILPIIDAIKKKTIFEDFIKLRLL